MTTTQPTASETLNSLASAADAARQVYMTAFAANPGADLSQLYLKEMEALAVWSSAQAKALKDDSEITKAKSDLDALTQTIKDELSTIKNVSTWMTLLDNLVKLATNVGTFFA